MCFFAGKKIITMDSTLYHPVNRTFVFATSIQFFRTPVGAPRVKRYVSGFRSFKSVVHVFQT